MFVQLPDEEKERLAHESGLDLEYVGLLRKCMYGAVDASTRRQLHYAQILKKHSFVQGLSNSFSFVHMEGDVRVVVHGDDVMVEMPTHEEKWFEIVLLSKYDGKCTGNFDADVIAAMGASFLNRVIRWDPTSGWTPTRARFNGASRSGIGEVISSCGGRHLRERPVGAIVFEPQTLPGVWEVFCDADHAGDLGTRKSALEWRSCGDHI